MGENKSSRTAATLYLVRHGATEGGVSKGYKGTLDVPISEEGIEEMKITADFIMGHVLTSSMLRRESYLQEIHKILSNLGPGQDNDTRPHAAVYCSGLSRAHRSAEIIARLFNSRPVVVDELRERHFGAWEGMSFGEIKRDFADEFGKWASDPVTFSPPGGETTRAVYDRTVDVLSRLLNNPDSPDNIIIVAHGGVNRVILCHILGIPLQNIFRIEQDSGAVSIIEFWGRHPVVKFLNLSPAMIQMAKT